MPKSTSTIGARLCVALLLTAGLITLPNQTSGQPVETKPVIKRKLSVPRTSNPIFVVLTDKDSGHIDKGGPFILGEDGADLSSVFQISSFDLTVVHHNKDIYNRIVKTSPYESKFLRVIESTDSGDLILWENIKVIDTDKKTRTLVSVVARKTNSKGLWEIRKSGPCVK